MSEKKTKKQPKMTNTPPPAGDQPAGDQPAPKSIGEVAKANAEKRRSIAQKDVFVFLKSPEKPIAPQATTILNTIFAHPDGIVRPALVEALKSVLVTRQPAERILTYYQAALVDAGLVRIDNPERAAKTAAPATEGAETTDSQATA